MPTPTRQRLLLLVAGFALSPLSPALAAGNRVDLRAVDAAAELGRVAPGQRVQVAGVPLGSAGDTLELERVEVFSADARIVVHHDGGESLVPPPRNAYFRGEVAGRTGSRALVTVRESGGIRGVIADQGEFWVLAPSAPGAAASPVEVRKLDAEDELASQLAEFACSAGELVSPPSLLAEAAAAAAGATPAAAAAPPGVPAAATVRNARLAIETDHEYYQRFTTQADRIDYAGDLIGYAAGIYAAETGTGLEISRLDLWATPADPWDQSSTRCSLYQFGRWWNQNRAGEERTLAHFLSGRSLGGGIAWVGALCQSPFNVNHGGECPGLTPQSDAYGGGYGFSGSISGSFDVDNPGVVWDLVVVAHEIGHNFNSPHTHCYNGLGGSAEPVDRCYGSQQGCYAGSAALPCPNAGGACGTLMSYCHLLGGGLANMALTFGSAHPFGVLPGRVPQRMASHADAAAAATPGCFAAAAFFADGFESGTTGAWSAAVD